MKRRIVAGLLVLLGALAGGPAWGYWGGKDSIEDKIDALITIEVLPLNAEVRLDGALLGTALQIANQGQAVYGDRSYNVTITAPGFRPRSLTVVTNSSMPQRVYVELVPVRIR